MAGRVPRRRSSLPLLATLLLLAHQARSQRIQTLTPGQLQDWRSLATGVGEVLASGISCSQQLLYGNGTMALAVDGSGQPFISAARIGSGRVAVFGHEGMLAPSGASSSGLGRLVLNAATWASGRASAIRVAGSSSWGAEVAAQLAQASPAFTSAGEVLPSQLASTPKPHLYIVNGQEYLSSSSAAAIQAFVKAGGGLIAGGQAWYWASAVGPVDTFPLNVLLAPLGIFTTAGYSGADTTLGSPPSQLGNADLALACLADTFKQNASSPYYLSSAQQVSTALMSVHSAAWLLSLNSTFWARLKQAVSAAPTMTSGINPDQPVRASSLDGLAAAVRTISYQRLPPEQLPAAPDAKFFPGLPQAGAQPLGAVKVSINATTVDAAWHSTGLYAMPGKVVTVAVPQTLVTAAAGGMQVLVGGWTDDLWNHDEWGRLPQIVRGYGMPSTSVKVASAVGGLIYMNLPGGLKVGAVAVTITGAIRSPRYVLGATKAADWPTIRAYPAPWGEIGSGKLIIATPRAALMKVSDPAAVATYWDKVMDSHAWLAGIPAQRAHPMRFQHDQAISVGYMHAGYPIMTFLDVVDSTLDPAAGHWGHLHELGHNHQSQLWTWGCTVEVTVNLFSARAMLAVKNSTDPRNFYGWWGDDVTARLQGRAEYFASGPSYDKLCGSPSLFLDSYLQVIEDGKFGFDLIRRTILSYARLLEQPSTDVQKANTWVKQQSRQAGVNLAPYYTAWGWPVTPETAAALASLPTFRLPAPPPAQSPPRRQPPPPASPPASRCVDYSALVRNVRNVSAGWSSSKLVMWGPAVPLLAGKSGDFYAAAARHGAGRAVVFGHEAMMSASSGGMGQLMRNAALWAVGLGGSGGGSRKLCASEASLAKPIADALARQDTRLVSPALVAPGSLTATCQLYVMTGYDTLTEASVAKVQAWVKAGGGLLLGGHVWGSNFTDPGAQWPGNQVLLPMGILVHSDSEAVSQHSVPSACPSALNLVDAAARALRSSSISSADRALAFRRVDVAFTYVPNTPATKELWDELSIMQDRAGRG